MKTRILLITTITLINLFLIAQNSKNNSYGRYEGTADSNIHVTANIVKLDGNLTGNYNYHNPGNGDNESYSNSIPFTGDLTDQNFSLNSYGNNDILLSGIMDQGTLNGDWYYQNDNVIPFEVSEQYPEGSIPFVVYYLHSEDRLLKDNTDSPVAEIELTLIYPINSETNTAVDSVCYHIANGFFGNGFFHNIPDSMLTRFENEYYNNYSQQNLERYDNGASFNWQKVVSMSVINNSDYLLCVEFIKYAFTGGAHGMTNIAYQNINLKDGNELTYNDIFNKDSKILLSELLTEQLYTDKQIPTDITLKKAGYFVESIEPNYNIYINNTGIGFLYNSYEIAPTPMVRLLFFLNMTKSSIF